jgi:hypothetical protein
MTRVNEKHIPHKQQQGTSNMIPHLSTEMMLQSLWRRGQQLWRDGYCSHGGLLTATATDFLWPLRTLLAHYCANHLHVCTSTKEDIRIESGRRAPEIKYVQLYTTHTNSKQRNFLLLAGQHRHKKKHNTTSPHQQPCTVNRNAPTASWW